MNRLADITYITPWMRIIPYIIGIIAGYILAKLNNNLILKNVEYYPPLLFTLLSITY